MVLATGTPLQIPPENIDQIQEVVRLRGVYENSPVRNVDCTVRFTITMQRPRIYLKPG